ncbi:MAG TPA: riboflavin synthase [Nitrospinae bacterium]|jgi:riboflavin synthase|nr:riboflavin synthase [Nitrospinota bacterium]
MFSGIIESVGTLREFVHGQESAVAVVETDTNFSGLEDGESIAVNGVCLTVVEFSEFKFRMDLGTETLEKTSFKNSKAGDRVNLERSLTPSSKISGHFVSGHVDQVGEVLNIEEKPGEILVQFSHPASLRPYIMEKGSIALDGISLTVFNCKDDKFNVSIIPFTWSHTNLSTRKIGDLINIECDMIGKYVYKACATLMNPEATGPVLDLLRQQGKE